VTVRRGFSLLEVMISGSLFLLAIAGFVGAVSATSDVRRDARLFTVAAELAEEQLERLLAAASDAPELRRGQTHEQRVNDAGVASQTGGFVIRWTVSPVTDVPSVSRIALQVEWHSGTRPRTLSLETCRE
jgi:Tfp pilus assembly protein PilV